MSLKLTLLKYCHVSLDPVLSFKKKKKNYFIQSNLRIHQASNCGPELTSCMNYPFSITKIYINHKVLNNITALLYMYRTCPLSLLIIETWVQPGSCFRQGILHYLHIKCPTLFPNIIITGIRFNPATKLHCELVSC